MLRQPYPNLIAICGFPEAGKSAVQRIMLEQWGVVSCDDGKFLRDIAKANFGLTDWHVYTQEGKSSSVEIAGRIWVVRDVLGTIGKAFEDKFGDEIIGEIACNSIETRPGHIYSFGSVRKTQGHAYKRRGGIVIEVVRPGKAAKYDFDVYDKSVVDFTIQNDNSEDWHERLSLAVRAIIEPIHKIARGLRPEILQSDRARVDVI